MSATLLFGFVCADRPTAKLFYTSLVGKDVVFQKHIYTSCELNVLR